MWKINVILVYSILVINVFCENKWKVGLKG